MFRRPPLGSATLRRSTQRPGNARPVVRRRQSGSSDDADPCGRSSELARLEAALFVAEEPLSPARLAEVARLPDVAAVQRLIAEYQLLLERDGSPFEVMPLADGVQLLTRPEFQPWLARVERGGADVKLSPTLLETLAVVAYRQPLTRADVEAVRGVACGEPLRQLLEKGLVRHAGRDSSLGRPQRYATTRRFLQLFGLRTLAELPDVPDLPRPRG